MYIDYYLYLKNVKISKCMQIFFFFYIKCNDKSEAHAYIITKIHLFCRDNWKTHSTKCTVVNKKETTILFYHQIISEKWRRYHSPGNRVYFPNSNAIFEIGAVYIIKRALYLIFQIVTPSYEAWDTCQGSQISRIVQIAN